MKKLGLVLCAVLLVFGSFQLAVADNYNKIVVDWCKAMVDNGVYTSVGDCVSAYNSEGWVTNMCKMFVEWGYYDTVGKCVSGFRSNEWAAKFCKAPNFVDPTVENWKYFNFKSRGDCVSYIAAWKW